MLGLEFGERLNFRRSRLPGKLAKLDCLWDDGVFLGYRSTSGEVIVGTDKGVFRTRTVTRKPEDHRWDAKNLDMVGGVPWRTSPEGDAQENAGEDAMPAIEIPMEIEDPGMQRPEMDEKEVVPRRLYIKASDIGKHGASSGCKGCIAHMRGAGGVAHSEACRKRLTGIIAQSAEGESRIKAAEERRSGYDKKLAEACEDAEKGEKRRRTVGEGHRESAGGAADVPTGVADAPGVLGSASGLKRDREDVDDGWRDPADGTKKKAVKVEEPDEQSAEEARNRDMDIEQVEGEYLQVACEGGDFVQEDPDAPSLNDEGAHEGSTDQEGFVDSRTGEILDAVKVKEAREEELKELERRVYETVDVDECWSKKGRGPIGVRWVDVHKGNGVYRSRLVAKDFRPKSRVDDIEGLFAAMPPLELVKLLIARAATESQRGHVRKIMLIDIGKAHLYAPVEGDVYVELPPERWEHGKCARLLYTLYGMRTAASSWEKEYSRTLEEAGFAVGRASACSFYHSARDVRIVVHGDDFVVEGQDADLKWVEGLLRAKYPVKVRGVLGPEENDDKQAEILNRKVCWNRDSVTRLMTSTLRRCLRT